MKSTSTRWNMKKMHGLTMTKVATTMMTMLAVLTLSSSSSMVSAEHHDKTLLETNALGYTLSRPDDVSYSENFEVDKDVRGDCVNGAPPDGILAPDAQTTTSDSQCQALGACHIGFTKVSYKQTVSMQQHVCRMIHTSLFPLVVCDFISLSTSFLQRWFLFRLSIHSLYHC